MRRKKTVKAEVRYKGSKSSCKPGVLRDDDKVRVQ